MWNLIACHTMPPTRVSRYCYTRLKESNGKGFVNVTGVRWAESVRRKQSHSVASIYHSNKDKRIYFNDDNDEARRTVESCYKNRSTLVNPIIDWTDEDVWEFIKTENMPYCELYDCGYKRLGCIGCPMQGKMILREMKDYPKYFQAYARSFKTMFSNNQANNIKMAWKNPKHVMEWWIYGTVSSATKFVRENKEEIDRLISEMGFDENGY